MSLLICCHGVLSYGFTLYASSCPNRAGQFVVQRESMIPVCLARSWRHRKTGLVPCASSLPYPPVFVLRGARTLREVCLLDGVRFRARRLFLSSVLWLYSTTPTSTTYGTTFGLCLLDFVIEYKKGICYHIHDKKRANSSWIINQFSKWYVRCTTNYISFLLRILFWLVIGMGVMPIAKKILSQREELL